MEEVRQDVPTLYLRSSNRSIVSPVGNNDFTVMLTMYSQENEMTYQLENVGDVRRWVSESPADELQLSVTGEMTSDGIAAD